MTNPIKPIHVPDDSPKPRREPRKWEGERRLHRINIRLDRMLKNTTRTCNETAEELYNLHADTNSALHDDNTLLPFATVVNIFEKAAQELQTFLDSRDDSPYQRRNPKRKV